MEISTYYSTLTTGQPEEGWRKRLRTAYQILIPITLAFIMLAMGCDIQPKVVIKTLKRPLAPIIGASCQFILLPLVAFGMGKAFNYETEIGVGMLIVACCPGGAVSNIFCYWTRGNLTLSVTMTSISTVLAFGFMPLNLFIYTRGFNSRNVKVPYLEIFLGLVLTLVPLTIGGFIKRFFPKAAGVFIRIGSFAGIAMIIMAGIMQRFIYSNNAKRKDSWKIILGAAILPLLGFFLGFGISSLAFKWLKMPERRTIAFETSCQNVGLALTLVSFAFKGTRDQIGAYTQFPLFFSLFMMVEAIGLCIFIKGYQIYKDKKRVVHESPQKDNLDQNDHGKIPELTESENGVIINKAFMDSFHKL
ncbi:DgyrCDS8728 [Dimorphilus gyrociliatus]|uniref:DgyrCDS8728 n=1 Tax=Dimorphilus gyrociliatus TaxID=2664684 RepID=A0A7I8VV39_9ANNE|nr:DgyrCDS8728 [Dimorphilus gyrociliatus]